MSVLYVLRHGIAVSRGTAGVADDERPLTEKGRKRMQQVAVGLLHLDLAPDQIITSPLPRARETAEIVAEALGMSDRLEEAESLRDDRSAAAIRDWLFSRVDDRLMIVGHNPALSDLLGLLVTGSTDFSLCELKKGAVAALSTRIDGGFTLDWMAPPLILRRLAGA
jgi:phosphohistidine phosphatase